jgi:hypothetical protein
MRALLLLLLLLSWRGLGARRVLPCVRARLSHYSRSRAPPGGVAVLCDASGLLRAAAVERAQATR